MEMLVRRPGSFVRLNSPKNNQSNTFLSGSFGKKIIHFQNDSVQKNS